VYIDCRISYSTFGQNLPTLQRGLSGLTVAELFVGIGIVCDFRLILHIARTCHLPQACAPTLPKHAQYNVDRMLDIHKARGRRSVESDRVGTWRAAWVYGITTRSGVRCYEVVIDSTTLAMD